MIGSTDLIEKRIREQDGVAFDRGVEFFQDSRFARNQRTKIAGQLDARGVDLDRGGVTYDEVREHLNSMALERANLGLSSSRVSVDRLSLETDLTIGEMRGVGPAAAIGLGALSPLESIDRDGGSMRNEMRQWIDAQREQTVELRRLNTSLQTQRNRNANGE